MALVRIGRKELNVLPELESWVKEHVAPPEGKPSARKDPLPRTPVTDLDRAALLAIATVRYPPATTAKRFARTMQGAIELTDGQREFLWVIAFHFRRQISDSTVLAEATRRNAANEE